MRENRTHGSEGGEGESPSRPPIKRAGHIQQLGGESPLHSLMEVKC